MKTKVVPIFRKVEPPQPIEKMRKRREDRFKEILKRKMEQMSKRDGDDSA